MKHWPVFPVFLSLLAPQQVLLRAASSRMFQEPYNPRYQTLQI